jgi:hypothetical protein
MRWVDAIEPFELDVACSGVTHLIRWQRGVPDLVDHHDVDAELALIAFGGDEPSCLEHLRLWNDAVADGGFLGEWVDEDLDQARLWWLGMALERMRSEGFHEFLRDLPLARAARMGHFLTTFPSPVLDLAAAAVAEALVDGDDPVCNRAAGLLPIAVARRLRRSFVSSIGGRQIALGGAALVPFEPIVASTSTGVDIEPFAEGIIRGRSSWVRIGVNERWLFDVWGAGAAVVDGHLVLSIDYDTERDASSVPGDPSGLVVHWKKAIDGGDTAEVRKLPLRHDGQRWSLAEDSLVEPQ